MNEWPELVKQLSAQLRHLRGGAPDVMKAFSGIAQAAVGPKALDGKTKELIALAIAVAIRCDDCIGFHAKAAFEHGATRDEVSEALGMAIYMGAGPLRDVCQSRLRGVRAVRKREGGRPRRLSKSGRSVYRV